MEPSDLNFYKLILDRMVSGEVVGFWKFPWRR